MPWLLLPTVPKLLLLPCCRVQERRGLSLAEIEAATFVDATSNDDLQANLKKNPKVAVEGELYRYKVNCPGKGKESTVRRSACD